MTVFKRSVLGCIGAVVFGAAVAMTLTGAQAHDGRVRSYGLIGGMSAAEVMGAPYYSAYGYNYAAPAYYAPPDGPPPGCVIRNQRLWDGYAWRWRKLRVCH